MAPRVETEAPAPRLHINHRAQAGALVVAVSGEVDSQTAPALGDALLAASGNPRLRPCIVDLTAVTFLSAAGLTTLIEATLHARPGEEPRLVVNGTSPVIRPIEVTGLDEELKLYHSIDEAVSSPNAPQPRRES
ncbi:STAS domain-containing protein [Amycolatopsis lurida]